MRILFCILFAFSIPGCQSSTEENKNITAADSIISRDIIIEGSRIDTPPPPPPRVLKTNYKGAELIREGKHQLTLQWISWDRPGSVTIKQVGDSLYSVKGRQENPKNKDYVSVDGVFKALSKRELLFEGTVTMQVETVNAGKPCVKKGPMTFLAKGSRQYWRMQDMINCEGGMITDYVDVYFK